ncbi:hypothetical protein K470DRAFT_254339 [Piedraia hortae CBS 480.64]|uniref:Tcp11-domain-containing protein n=1 Tax=Piedraia hortae CBS 480.64 TaxID=1314780 RepID=A0A6A7C935_9PEZI|nr:hypothetical protein K470DRAFT_254339 [Piedraia hortae CBS 480.64]
MTGNAPPAHLNARLCCNHSRRKSSATSSRRNSLSSAHSHASSRSYRRRLSEACQSHHVAQHLRRASIIQSRKDRLADRAVHAEQVRLRAALAKAAPRVCPSSIEEKALAAQLAKEKYLAKVAATCAEEVARAKRIAEEVKERKLAEEARLRVEMEERQEEARKRRLGFQRSLQTRRARRVDSAAKGLAVVEEVGDEAVNSNLNEDIAARRIQRAWRLARQRAIVDAFMSHDVTVDATSRTSFEELTELLGNATIISATTAMLTHMGLQAADDEHAALNTRTFLSAYMVAAHPEQVLQNQQGAQEQDLLAKAGELLQSFETAISRLAPWNNYHPDPMEREALSQSYSAYTSAFAAWRLQDSSVLIEGMVASFVEMDAILQTIQGDTRGEAANDYRAAIRDNQVMLLARIKKLAGTERATELIKKGIRDSRRRRPKKPNVADVRPRVVEPSHPEEESEQSVDAAEALTQAAAEWPLGGQSTTDITRQIFSPMPSNRVLAHEMAIDKDYRLVDRSQELRADLYRSICAAMKQGFESGNGAMWTISAAENIREKLLRMLKAGNSMHNLISEALDLENINRQCQAGIFSYEAFFEFMANVLPKVCAPFRDAEIAAVSDMLRASPAEDESQLHAMIGKLFKLMRTVDMLSLDYTNFMLMNAAPTLIREAPGYEARSFAADLECGRITLERTKRWYRTAYDALSAEADGRDPEGIRLDRVKPEKAYARGLVDLAVAQGQLEDDTIPETLHLDAERLRHLRQRSVRITVIGAVLLTAKSLLKRDGRSQWKNEAARLWQLLDDQTQEASDIAHKAFSVLETAHNMPPQTKQQLSGTIGRFLGQANTGLTDPVLKVLFQRLRTHVYNRLSAFTSSERVRAASSATEALTSIGLGEMTAHVAAMVTTLERVKVVDWQAHAQWYEQIIS